MSNKSKIFQDTVHGYITIPSEYCSKFIDSLHFQRLRRIEQTSIRSIFPSARHDRFVHSLGTFFLGNKIFDNILKNSPELQSNFKPEDITRIGNSYKIACLLHDCGHTPFSHSFEHYYDTPGENSLSERLKREANNLIFSQDITLNADAKEHEKISALILLKIFSNEIAELDADPLLSARMIIGCRYIEQDTALKKLENCFIALLNGNIIDADRLDYYKRDRWASGYNSANLDLERLISSIRIQVKSDGNYIVCFYKNAISEIHNFVESRDFQSTWIFSHHKVVYDQFLLEKSVEKLAELMNPNLNREDAISKLFNVDCFFEPYSINSTNSIYLPSDDDIVHFLKMYLDTNTFAKEWFSRQHSLKPLWKSYSEYICLFKEGVRQDQLEKNKKLDKNTDKALDAISRELGIDLNYYKKVIENKNFGINHNDVYISINDEIYNYDKIIHQNPQRNSAPFFFYLFVPNEIIQAKQRVIAKMISYAQS